MRSLRNSVLGTVIGMLVGAAALVVPYLALLIGRGAAALPAAVLISTIGGGAVTGALCASAGCLVTKRERSLLGVLTAVAAASLTVLPGHYANGSAIPPALYAAAVITGLLVARAVGPLCRPSRAAGERYLS